MLWPAPLLRPTGPSYTFNHLIFLWPFKDEHLNGGRRFVRTWQGLASAGWKCLASGLWPALHISLVRYSSILTRYGCLGFRDMDRRKTAPKPAWVFFLVPFSKGEEYHSLKRRVYRGMFSYSSRPNYRCLQHFKFHSDCYQHIFTRM